MSGVSQPRREVVRVSVNSGTALMCGGSDGCGAYLADHVQHTDWHQATDALLTAIAESFTNLTNIVAEHVEETA